MNEDTSVVKPMAHPEGDKLDGLMDLFMSYIKYVCYQKGMFGFPHKCLQAHSLIVDLFTGELKWEECEKIFRELLTAFDQLIVKIYASSHAQFIMFYICSFKDVMLVCLVVMF
jgi:RNA polymerase I-specific transcription initiation factor RRN3